MKQYLLHLFILITLVFIPMTADGQLNKNLTVDLVLSSTQEKKDKTAGVSATLIIRNSGSTEIKAEHPGNRMAVAFIVMNSLGNVISPVGLAKADPPFREFTVKPNSEVKQTFPNLEFITGSAKFGYELKTGEIYRVVAIYRPNGEKNAGIATDEQIITVK